MTGEIDIDALTDEEFDDLLDQLIAEFDGGGSIQVYPDDAPAWNSESGSIGVGSSSLTPRNGGGNPADTFGGRHGR